MSEIVNAEMVWGMLNTFKGAGMDLSILDFQVYDVVAQEFAFPTGEAEIKVSDDGTTGSFTLMI